MSEIQAWEWLRGNLGNSQRTPIPDAVRKSIKFAPGVGCYAGSLVTRNTAIHIDRICEEFNKEK